MKVLLAGGGTAGHINPALAIAGFIKKMRPDTEFLFIGNKDGMEQNLEASYVTLPDGASLADVTVGPDKNHEVTKDDTHVNVPLVFSYGDFTVGTATLTYKAASAGTEPVGMLPVRAANENEDGNDTTVVENKPFVIDIRILIGIGLALLAIFIIWAIAVSAAKRRERNAYYKSRKRKF